MAPYLHLDDLSAARQDRLGRVSDRRRDPDRRRRAARARRGPPRAGVLPADREHRAAARHRLRLRAADAARPLRPPALARRRMDRLLPPLGRGRAASVDGPARPAGARPRGRAQPLPAGPADVRVARRARDRDRPRPRASAISTTPRCARRRSSSSGSSSCGWPGSCASRTARSSASAGSAAPVPSSSPPPTATRSTGSPSRPPRRSPRPARRSRCAATTDEAAAVRRRRPELGMPAAGAVTLRRLLAACVRRGLGGHLDGPRRSRSGCRPRTRT